MQRFFAALRRYRWYLLAGCTLFFAARWGFSLGKPQRLIELPPDDFLTVRDGMAYFRVNDSLPPTRYARKPGSRGLVPVVQKLPAMPLVIRAVPVTGGRPHIVARDNTPDRYFEQVMMTEAGVVYLAYPGEPPQIKLQQFAASPNSAPTILAEQGHERPAILRRISRPGSPAETVTPEALKVPVRDISVQRLLAVLGTRAVWIESRPSDWRPRKGLPAQEIPHNEVRAVSLQGGSPQTLMMGVPARAQFIAQEKAVWWSMPGSRPGLSDFYCLDIQTGSPVCVLRDTQVLGVPVIAGERLYWFGLSPSEAALNSSAGPNQNRSYPLFSARRDGSDLRLLNAPRGRLHVYRDHLYLVARDNDNPPDLRPELARHSLYQMDLPAEKFRRIASLPSRTGNIRCFDGDYAYFVRDEERENWFDWSAQGVQTQTVRVLYRLRLPD